MKFEFEFDETKPYLIITCTVDDEHVAHVKTTWDNEISPAIALDAASHVIQRALVSIPLLEEHHVKAIKHRIASFNSAMHNYLATLANKSGVDLQHGGRDDCSRTLGDF